MKTNSFLILILFLTCTVGLSQVAVNMDGTSADPSAILDVKSTSLGFLPPRMTTSQRNSIGSPAEGLTVYDNTLKNIFFHNGSTWQEIQSERLWSRFVASSKTWLNNLNDSLGIGTINPSYRLHLWDNNLVNDKPIILLEQTGLGDASLGFYQNSAVGAGHYSIGLDRSHNAFKICDSAALTGNSYTNSKTMMTISRNYPGITHFNHQSRARAFLNGLPFTGPQTGQAIPWNTWYAVSFDFISWDEQNEYIPGIVPGPPIPPPVNPTSGKFITKEEGYYQINARTEFILWEIEQSYSPSYVSIAIFVNGLPIAYGNKLNIFDLTGVQNTNNDAPVVCDVVHLIPGDVVEIYVFQNYSQPTGWILGSDLTTAPPKVPGSATYVSIHKIS